MNIIGDGFPNSIINQVIQRQKIYGSGYYNNRKPEEIIYLNANTSWCKLVSSVNVDNLKNVQNQTIKNLGLAGNNLAKQFVLFNGTYNESGNGEQRSGIDLSNSLSGYNFAYGIGGTDFGLRPMMGIQSVEVKHENRGSIRRATVKMKAWNRAQFDIIDILYLRLGFNVLLEWGHSMYYNNDGELVKGSEINNSLVDEFLSGKSKTPIIRTRNVVKYSPISSTATTSTTPLSNVGLYTQQSNPIPLAPDQKFQTTTSTEDYQDNNLTYDDFLNLIQNQRLSSNGNYDAMFAKVTNFHWSFQKDGSYDIELNLVSVGDVMESFKVNLLNKGLQSTSTEATKEPLTELTDEEIITLFANQHSIGQWFYELSGPSREANKNRVAEAYKKGQERKLEQKLRKRESNTGTSNLDKR